MKITQGNSAVWRSPALGSFIMARKFLALLLPGRAFPLLSNLHWRVYLPGDLLLHDQDKCILRLEETAHGEVRHLFFIDKMIQQIMVWSVWNL